MMKSELRIVRCRRCRMMYADPVRAEFASGTYYDKAGQDYYLSPDKLQGDYADVRFERELRLFRRHCPSGTVLDVGCSSGGFLFQLRKRFPGAYEILGTDVSGAPLNYAEAQGLPVIRGDFLRQDYGDRRFDAITFWAVLEHLFDPGAFVRRARDLLKPGGLCFILVPNMNSAAVRLLGSHYRYIYPEHLNYFTRDTLCSLLDKNSLQIAQVRTTHFNPIVILQDWRSGGRDVSDAERAKLLKRTSEYKRSLVLAPARVAYSLTEKALSAAGLADNLAVVAKP
jgi:2-polyprenyl-3-methyl-5-hydroxy-6-metoxy-1,4-benzoquinol methylase